MCVEQSPDSVGTSEGEVEQVFAYCVTVVRLASWTEYVVGVRAWAEDQVSMAAPPILAITRRDCEYQFLHGRTRTVTAAMLVISVYRQQN